MIRLNQSWVTLKLPLAVKGEKLEQRDIVSMEVRALVFENFLRTAIYCE